MNLLLTDKQRDFLVWCETTEALMRLERQGGLASRDGFTSLVGSAPAAPLVTFRRGQVQITEKGRRFLNEGRGLSKYLAPRRRYYGAGA